MLLSDLIADLKSKNKTNDKRAILQKNKNNEALQLLFKMTSDPSINYWIKADKKSAADGQGYITKELLENINETLNGRLLTGNAARDYLLGIIQSLTRAEGEIIIKMINRDLDCKVSTSLINECWPNTIFVFPVMLAAKFNQKTSVPFYAAETWNKPGSIPKLIVQLKCDGGRFCHISGEGSFSRNGSKLEVHDRFDFLNKIFSGYVVDGELLAVENGKVLPRHISNGLYTKAVRNTLSKEESKLLHLVVWDLIPMDEFKARKGKTPYRDRLTLLESIISKNKQQFGERISLVEGKIIDSVHAAQIFYGEKLEEGQEGAMLKLLDAPWEDDRADTVLKMKEEKDATLICYAVTEHKKKKGMIGSLECRTSCGNLEVSIGSGLKDDDRTKDPEYFIGKLIDMKFNALIQAKNSKTYSMFLPIFRGIRVDVNEADSLEKLIEQSK